MLKLIEATEATEVAKATEAAKVTEATIELTPDEAKLLSFYAELRSGLIPLDSFKELAESYLRIEDVDAAFDGLFEKSVLDSNAYHDEERESFGFLNQGDDVDYDTLIPSEDYDAALAKYLPQSR
jgi:hypothetical protein